MQQKPARDNRAVERRITVPVPAELSDRIDAAVFGMPGETLKSLTLRAIEREIDRLEEERGADGVSNPFPPAPGRPPPGRPRKTPVGVGEPLRAGAVAPSDSSAEVERLLHVLEQADAGGDDVRVRARSVGKA